jgi:hypothetical protein
MTISLQITLNTGTYSGLAELASAHGIPLDRIASGFVADGVERQRPHNPPEGMPGRARREGGRQTTT